MIASTFYKKSAVLGYELINEPWMGDLYADPDLLIPGVADKKNLQPMYQNINAAIRSVDETHLVFFEPVTWDYWPCGFTQPPGGESYSNRSVLSYHIYCLGYDDGHMTPLLWDACNFTAFEMMDFRKRDQERLKVGGFMTEWGDIHSQDSDAVDLLVYLSDKADDLLQSWTYWAGMVNTEAKIVALSRTYAQAVAGTPTKMQFDNETSIFTLEFEPDLSIQSPTVVYLNNRVRYTQGFIVTTIPTGSLNWNVSSTKQPYLLHFYPSQQLVQEMKTSTMYGSLKTQKVSISIVPVHRSD